MTSERTLLERLSNPQSGAPRTTRQNEAHLIASVLDHLVKMLNTRRGNAPVAPDYGIPDLVDLVHSFPDAIRLMEQAIRVTIEKYEPRLSKVRVRYSGSEEDVFSIHFDISGVLSPSDSGRSVSFETMVGSNGRVSIRG